MSEPTYRLLPMYRQIAEDLRGKIESGELPPGTQMKTEVGLQEEYSDRAEFSSNVSRNTVRDAIKLLVSRGLVETRPGQGTFVVKRMQPFISKLTADPEAGGVEDTVYRSEVERQGRTPQETLPRVEVQSATEDVAAHLELDEGAQVISRHQKRRIDGTPWSLQTTFYPMELLQRGTAATRLLEATSVEDGMTEYLRKHLQINQVGWRDTISGRAPNRDERDFFELSDKIQVAIFEFRRVGFDEAGKPIRLTVTVYPADRNQFEMEAGRVPPPPSMGPSADEGQGHGRDRSG
jgi:GntR family transcriptional regulator